MSLLECSFNTTILLTPKHTQSKMIYIQIKNRFKIGPIKTKDKHSLIFNTQTIYKTKL